MSVSRRSFVRGAGMAGTAVGLGASKHVIGQAAESMATARQSDPTRQDDIWIDALGGLRFGPEGFDEIERSGLTMIETTLGAPGDPPFGYEQAVQDIASWHGIFNRYPHRVIHVRRVADILEAKRTGRIAVMIGFQNATHLQRDLANVEFFYNLGIRQMQLTYNSLNALGAGCTERVDVGLSDFGVEVVEKMNELGMIVDVSHTGMRSTMDAIEVSSAPVLFTHANCRALCDNPRCKTDEQIRALAAHGGVMGITTVNFFVSKKPRSTLDDFIDHIAHVADLVGIDYVGIGTDSSIGGWRVSFPTEQAFWDFHEQFHFKPEVDVRWPPFIEELDRPEKMHIIAERLEQRGFSGGEVAQVMGGNFLRVYEEILG
ncbi:MAG: dipeptidase [Gemmatimonadota bacterium]|nr:dipeptidase [Gemmatimonadota bacterium]